MGFLAALSAFVLGLFGVVHPTRTTASTKHAYSTTTTSTGTTDTGTTTDGPTEGPHLPYP